MAEKKTPQGKRTVDKWKRKVWFSIIAPPEFDMKELGGTPADKPKNVIGRTVLTNLGVLTGERQKRHIKVKFRVTDVQGQQAKTEFVGHEISYSYLGRLIRRRSSKIEVTQTVTTKDGKKFKLKSVCLSAKKLARRQEREVWKAINKKVEASSGKKQLNQLVQEMLFGVLASKIFKEIRKIGPLKRLEIVKSAVIE